MLCVACGRLGHTSKMYPHVSLSTDSTPAQHTNAAPLNDKGLHNEITIEWKIVVFPRRHPNKLDSYHVAKPAHRTTLPWQDTKPTSSSSTSTILSGTPHSPPTLISTNHGLTASINNPKDIKLINYFNLFNQLDSFNNSLHDPQSPSKAQHP